MGAWRRASPVALQTQRRSRAWEWRRKTGVSRARDLCIGFGFCFFVRHRSDAAEPRAVFQRAARLLRIKFPEQHQHRCVQPREQNKSGAFVLSVSLTEQCVCFCFALIEWARVFVIVSLTGGLFPADSHEYEAFRFALSHQQDVPKLVPQVDMVKSGNSFSMTYACECHCVCVCVWQHLLCLC